MEDIGFYELAIPKYDVINWDDRASRGADGAPPPVYKTHNSEILITIFNSNFQELTTVDELSVFLKENMNKTVVIDFRADWCKSCKKIMPINFK